MSNIHALKGRNRTVVGHDCLICGKRQAANYRPFCSARCKQVDLGRWLGGDYRLPTEGWVDPEELTAINGVGENMRLKSDK